MQHHFPASRLFYEMQVRQLALYRIREGEDKQRTRNRQLALSLQESRVCHNEFLCLLCPNGWKMWSARDSVFTDPFPI